MSGSEQVRSLAARLEHTDARVRKIAAMDLGRLGTPEAGAVLTSFLAAFLAGGTERDEGVLIAAVRSVGAMRYRPGAGVLLALYSDARTPVRVAHEAIVSHDRWLT